MAGAHDIAKRMLDLLRTEGPKFHGREQAGSKDFSIAPQVLKWITNNVTPGGDSVETGCGYSTIVLAALCAKHTVISPFSQEHDLIKGWCVDRGVVVDHVDFIADPSQHVVPNLSLGQLDFILIDGDHAFPAPFIDWYYLADKLKVGGYVAVDDTQIPTGKLLRDFLSQESERWNLAIEIGRTAIFARKTASPVAKGIQWMQQPYCQIPTEGTIQRFCRAAKRVFQQP